VPVENIT
jgi:transposase InsO family protein